MCPRGLKQGDICSPILFSLFTDKLANEIIERGRHSIQLTPDLLENFILLFADDVIPASRTVCGLQNKLSILREKAERRVFFVNMDKSNLNIF